MIGDLFDSPWKILIVAVVLIVLFGSAKLPVAARSLGKSMRILKSEVKGLHEDEIEPGSAAPTPAQAGNTGSRPTAGAAPRELTSWVSWSACLPTGHSNCRSPAPTPSTRSGMPTAR